MTTETQPHAPLSHDRYCDEILAQTDLLRDHLRGADLAVTVPTCPDWTLRDLAVHVGGAHRWVETTVRTRAVEEVSEKAVEGFEGPADDDPAALDAWLADGARRTADTLRAAGPDEPCWTWSWRRDAGFWARRMAHETVVHRADAALAAGAAYDVPPELAADAVDEWLQIVTYGQRIGFDQALIDLRGPGRTLHLHATDTAPEVAAEWLIELRDEGVAWRRGHEKADVALRGPLTALLLAFYRRVPLDDARVEVLGERELLEFWLERATFG
ncbi:maleylpyruvate isomerase family mycothiol-dependent enzyme [Streptomyces longispororuber]|uniref:maleylpyruvate isomerase family mycothiol-dependent enzyme n=1 Tax=Streptomyces longispororuber TaxID=68230 RepID=UPI00210A97E2|nr:maleylpyruvate isomerase family mycothiol-dependent enzyme [Streptomyces longispororuber]MCQ4214292.1 maleylpyruvate isomerase family mycothiol-dependent enzyme [Streptomyces longispororuber]